MDEEMEGIEDERMANLQEARNYSSGNEEGVSGLAMKLAKGAASPTEKAKLILSFGKKISEHWLILLTAALFDLLAMIPIISVFFNIIFGIILFLYFGPKRKVGESEFLKIALPMGIGSALDVFLSVLPVNISATLIRIALN